MSWTRFPRGTPCVVCGHAGHCTIAPDRKGVKCTRAAHYNGVAGVEKPADSRGVISWLHRIDPESPTASAVASVKGKREVPRMTRAECETLAKRFRSAMSLKRLSALSAALGVSEVALQAYGLGWDDDKGCYAFPMRAGGKARDICGFRLRSLDGSKKKCVLGSREGLFIPDTYEACQPSTIFRANGGPVLLLPEGPTDAAMAWDAGYKNAVGRPSNCGGASDVRELLAFPGASPTDVIVFADYDPTKYLPNGFPYWPGHEGAIQLIASILPACKQLSVVFAEFLPGSDAMRQAARESTGHDCKVDLRSWVAAQGISQLPAAIATAAEPIGAKELQALVAGMDKYRAMVWDAWKVDHGVLPRLAGVTEQRRSPLAMVA